MNEKVNILVPVRSLREGKTRLSSVLSKADRYELSRRLLINTLSVATSVVGLSSVVVVSRCRDANDIVRSRDVRYLFEATKGGLNPAVTWASKVVSCRGIKRVLVLPFDLPLLTHEDLCQLIAKAGRNGAAIAPDRRLQGTNALCVPSGGGFRFRFGLGSFSRHKIEAERCSIGLRSVFRRSLSFDVDLPRDFSQLCVYESARGINMLTKGLRPRVPINSA